METFSKFLREFFAKFCVRKQEVSLTPYRLFYQNDQSYDRYDQSYDQSYGKIYVFFAFHPFCAAVSRVLDLLVPLNSTHFRKKEKKKQSKINLKTPSFQNYYKWAFKMDTYQYYSDERELVVSFFYWTTQEPEPYSRLKLWWSIYWSDIYVFVFFGGIKHAQLLSFRKLCVR